MHDDDLQGSAVERLPGDQHVLLGPGAVEHVGEVARSLGIGHAFVVSDPHLEPSGAMARLLAHLRDAGMQATVAVQASGPPREEEVDDAVDWFRTEHCDGVVSLGGGSVQDIGKCVSLLARQEGRLHEFASHAEGLAGRRPVHDKVPHVAVSTTAGTGAETSSIAFIAETRGHGHAVLDDPRLVPEALIIDPVLHTTMPRPVTAATGLNALAHAVEAYLSRAHTKRSDEAALGAIGRIGHWLPRAYDHGDDLEARLGMARAAYDAGRAFDEAGLGLIDSISLVLGSTFSVPHSLANAIVLPHVMAHDAVAARDRLEDVAIALGHTPRAGHGPEAAIDAVERLRARVGIRKNLREFGFDEDVVYLCAQRVLDHPYTKRSPEPLDRDAVAQVLLDAVELREARLDPR